MGTMALARWLSGLDVVLRSLFKRWMFLSLSPSLSLFPPTSFFLSKADKHILRGRFTKWAKHWRRQSGWHMRKCSISLFISQVQIKTVGRDRFTRIRKSIITQIITSLGWKGEKLEPLCRAGGKCLRMWLDWETVPAVLSNIKQKLAIQNRHCTPRFQSKGKWKYISIEKNCMQMFIMELLILATPWKRYKKYEAGKDSGHQQMSGWAQCSESSGVLFTHTRSDEVLVHARTRADFENILLTERGVRHELPHMVWIYLFIYLFIFHFKKFYCYSITVVCLFSLSLHPTPAVWIYLHEMLRNGQSVKTQKVYEWDPQSCALGSWFCDHVNYTSVMVFEFF